MSTIPPPKVKVAILDDYQSVAFTSTSWPPSLLSRLSIDTFPETIHDEDALVERLYPYEIICTMRERTKFPASLLDRLPNLKLISTTAMNNRGIDSVHAKSKGIHVSGTFGVDVGMDVTLEHIWALILSAVRHIVQEDANVKSGNPQWQSVVPTALTGKTLGLVGLGRLGTAVAQIAKAFNMNVLAWSPNLTAARAEATGVTFSPTKAHLFQTSDIVSIQLILSPSTEGIISASDLALLKPTAFFINTSRGPLVDELAVIKLLQEKKIAGAAFDVYDTEPLPLDHPMRSLGDIVTLSPHNGYVSDSTYKEWWGYTVENIIAYLDGAPVRLLA